jgi:crotonobetainyl-CoA:carnitine CoA-transferase CaiB-like acyl-CoA transferase
MMLQSDPYWSDFCAHLDRPELGQDPRFHNSAARFENRRECIALLREIFETRTFDEWCARFATLKGVWGPIKTPLEVHNDPQVHANGYLEPIDTANGGVLRIPANPVQFDETAPKVHRAPEHGEHTEEILQELGLSYDEILECKAAGAVL